MRPNGFPRVSVITIIKNLRNNGREDYFFECVNSVRKQKYENLEHVVIDGGSTDGTQEFLKERGIAFIEEADKGIAEGMNHGINHATGKYIIFLNSDDYFINETGLEKAISVMETSGADFGYSDVDFIRKTGEIKVRRSDIYPLFSVMSLCHQGMICRKDLFECIGSFDEDFRISGDYDFVLRSVESGAGYVRLAERFAAFREGGVSTTDTKMVQHETWLVHQKHYGDKISLSDTIQYMREQWIPFGILEKNVRKQSLKERMKFKLINFRHYVQSKRKEIFDIRTRKGKRRIILFGIHIIKEDKR